MNNISAAIAILSLGIASLNASADTLRWINPLGGNWSDESNWELGRLPTTGDDVRFDLIADYQVMVSVVPLYDTLSVTHGVVQFHLNDGIEMMNNPNGKFDYPTFDVRANSSQAVFVTVNGDMFASDTKFPGVSVGAGGVGPCTLTVNGSLAAGSLPTYTIGTGAPGTLVPNGSFGGILFGSSFGSQGRLVTSGFDCDELATFPGFVVELNGAINSDFGFYSCTFLAQKGSRLGGEAFVDLDVSALGAIECYGVGVQDSVFRLSNADASELQSGKFAFRNVEFIVRLDADAPKKPPQLIADTFFDSWIGGCIFRPEHGSYTPAIGAEYPLLVDSSGLGEDPGLANLMDSAPLGSIVLRPSWVDGTLYAIAIPEDWCDADFNFDGVVNVFDIFGFIDAYLDRSARANITEDFGLNFFDIQTYIDQYLAGCP